MPVAWRVNQDKARRENENMANVAVGAAGEVEAPPVSEKLTLAPLIALVVGSMIGGGVFNLPRDMSRGAGAAAIIIGWLVSGVGMLMLAFVYQGLAVRKPALNAGPYAYARAGFGEFVGFNSAWGYWISAFMGNVAHVVAIFSALSFFVPAFGHGNTWQSILGASICLWLVHTLVLKGVKGAAFTNIVTTAAKLVPLFLFILVAIIAFNWNKFTLDLWGTGAGGVSEGLGGIFPQVRSTMLVTLWVFIGIEGASVYSARAKNRSDIGKATVIGFLGVLGIYVLVSLLSTGILTQKELAGLKVPAMAGVFAPLVGNWGAALINLGLVVSVGGAFLSWTLLCAEILYICGRDGTFPRWFATENPNGSPANSLWATNGLIQLFLILSLFSQSAYVFFYSIASVAILPPYVFSGAYALKLALNGEGYARADPSRNRDMVVGLVSTVYGLWLVYAAGISFLLMTAILFAPGIIVFSIARREAKQRLFTAREGLIATALVVLAVMAIWLMATGVITPP
jgi:arginine:ornithine antiporter / lysine permease